jgi:hypothetical protein
MDALLCALCRSEGGAYMDDPASGSRRYSRRCIAKAGTRVALAQSVHVKEHGLAESVRASLGWPREADPRRLA